MQVSNSDTEVVSDEPKTKELPNGILAPFFMLTLGDPD
jgi:hypothetical protein